MLVSKEHMSLDQKIEGLSLNIYDIYSNCENSQWIKIPAIILQ
ncbi:Uncharacterised protein [BD1-7 clade bacterium]|uniref:Uncharacterized protein n=1 Tax=BD1-7 clade bacterium TaxID=2029982 RepID=A0A5S9QQS8_9GAMM|nr:Uncharacterised protein [BD1-7 clade bacterium]